MSLKRFAFSFQKNFNQWGLSVNPSIKTCHEAREGWMGWNINLDHWNNSWTFHPTHFSPLQRSWIILCERCVKILPQLAFVETGFSTDENCGIGFYSYRRIIKVSFILERRSIFWVIYLCKYNVVTIYFIGFISRSI